ncbi:MAG: hypothetical protein EBZ48_11140 [Proteobacteria bacterium]|nr:hypothetical protein [Pseudomonadota bacterium]
MLMKVELKDALKVSMKAGEKVRVETIRSALSAIQYEEVAQKVDDLPAAGIVEILKREIKKRKEEQEFAEKANRPDAIAKLNQEIATLEGFLPKQLAADELEKIIVELKAQNPQANMGLIMKALKDTYNGQYDSKLASELAKRIAG